MWKARRPAQDAGYTCRLWREQRRCHVLCEWIYATEEGKKALILVLLKNEGVDVIPEKPNLWFEATNVRGVDLWKWCSRKSCIHTCHGKTRWEEVPIVFCRTASWFWNQPYISTNRSIRLVGKYHNFCASSDSVHLVTLCNFVWLFL